MWWFLLCGCSWCAVVLAVRLLRWLLIHVCCSGSRFTSAAVAFDSRLPQWLSIHLCCSESLINLSVMCARTVSVYRKMQQRNPPESESEEQQVGELAANSCSTALSVLSNTWKFFKRKVQQK